MATRRLGINREAPPLARDGLGETYAVALGLAQMGVMHESVDGGRGDGLVESGRVQVRADGHRPSLVGGIDEA